MENRPLTPVTLSHHFRRGPKIMTYDKLQVCANKLFHVSLKSRAVDQLISEIRCTNKLQREVTYANRSYLKNFKLRLIMDGEEDNEERTR